MLSRPVSELPDRPTAGRSIDVDVQHAEKDPDNDSGAADGFVVLQALHRGDVAVRRADEVLFEHAFGFSSQGVSEEEQQCDPDQQYEGDEPRHAHRERDYRQSGAYDGRAEPFSKSVE